MPQTSLVLRLYTCKGCYFDAAAKSEASNDLNNRCYGPGSYKDREVGDRVGIPTLSVITNERKLVNNKQNKCEHNENERERANN